MEQQNTEAQETSATAWEESHPWLSKLTSSEEEDSLDEMVRFALDELRYA